GAGMALIVIVAGVLSGTVGLLGYLFPAVRNAEDLLPDHKQDAVSEPAEQQPSESLEGAPV
ncbi:MAG TPA: hypothetical protein VI451_19935, partial [Anaerolineales bacterium]|nr:hypothetical protein [Anaerolineales bacterium]